MAWSESALRYLHRVRIPYELDTCKNCHIVFLPQLVCVYIIKLQNQESNYKTDAIVLYGWDHKSDSQLPTQGQLSMCHWWWLVVSPPILGIKIIFKITHLQHGKVNASWLVYFCLSTELKLWTFLISLTFRYKFINNIKSSAPWFLAIRIERYEVMKLTRGQQSPSVLKWQAPLRSASLTYLYGEHDESATFFFPDLGEWRTS